METIIYTCYKNVNIFKLVFYGDNSLKIYKSKMNELVTHIPTYEKIWFGSDSKDRTRQLHFGNTVLIKLSYCIYMYIGEKIYYFNTSETIIDYVSDVKDGVSYPYAITDKGYLLLSAEVFIPIDIVSYKADFYDFYNKGEMTKIYHFTTIPVCNNYLF
jgi:hypothetical protein